MAVDSKHPTMIFTVAELEGRVVGYALIANVRGSGLIAGNLDLIAVLPEFSSNGIGTRLMRFAAKTAKEFGYIFLVATINNIHAKMYQGAGWTVEGLGAYLTWSVHRDGKSIEGAFTSDISNGYDRVAYLPLSGKEVPTVKVFR